MRLKSADGPLQAVHNRNNDILNSPKRINTVQNSNYSQNTQNTTNLYHHVTTNEITNITKNIKQLTIEDVAALNNGHHDTQELRWCNSDLNTTEALDQQQLNIQRQRAENGLSNNRVNINSNLAARLRLHAQNAQNNVAPVYKDEQLMPQSPDDDYDAHQSCSSSASASPQDEDRAFDPSDSAESSDEGNDYSTTDIRQTSVKGFVNPNYPGFQHLAHTLDFDEETLNNANNNNEEYELADKFDSVNRLDSVENIQKVFHEKSLDLDKSFSAVSHPLQESPNDSNSANCDSESECGGSSDLSAVNDENGSTVNESFNIRIDETKVIESVVEGNTTGRVDIQSDCVGKVENDESSFNQLNNIVESGRTEENSVVGDFRKEVEDELEKVSLKEQLENLYSSHFPRATELELEEAVEKLQVITDFQPSAAKYSIEINTDQPFSKESSPVIEQPLVLQDAELMKSSAKENPIMTRSLILQQKKEETLARMSRSLAARSAQMIKLKETKIDQNGVDESMEVDNQPKDRRIGKQVPSFLLLNTKLAPDSSQQIPNPIENKIADASLSCCQENLPKVIMDEPKFEKPSKMQIDTKDDKKMEVDCGPKKIDLGRRDSNRELEEIEIQIKKIKSDTMSNMKQMDMFRKEELTKDFREKDEDSSVLKKPLARMHSYVKKRRDYNQQFGSLITFPKREPLKRDPMNRRSVPMGRDRTKMVNPESLGSFDVYNIETAMPKIDLEAIENHLKAAREEERRRRTDREEIRRRLAMGNEDDYYSDRPGRKPSLQARLQSGMNLQICFMNETVSDTESPSSDNECPLTNPKPAKRQNNTNLNQRNGTGKVPQPAQRPATLSLHPVPPPQIGAAAAETDFFAKQARLQTEARMALAQAKEMARMQMEIEKQRQKKSPITEMVRHSLEKVGIPFPEEKRRLSRQILTEMNVAQLQVIVNDLHTQIETLNEQLVKFLMDRDDLHMEQDSMLVDIEDLTRYLGAKEQVIKDQLAPTPQNNNLLPPPSPAPSSPLTTLNNTVRPHLNRIASLVKK
ncbi:unnamed protein product [Ceutorhynchus assimilis]|uniref:Schwannomin interacting protein 1 C-terminal domain-containing protein n=1 Tax=Ceutorhynchus assimilis TaxID=467358 RepID=A0A9N9MSP2_9CUCU|nr:unnamed protein product [Ceutorhynchus assimilis]